METSLTVANNIAFDFESNNVESFSLDTLKRTHRENDIYGKPIRGMYHFDVIEQVAGICSLHNLNYEIEEIFAAQNKNKNLPGVVILPQIESTFGTKAVEAHVLRRVYTTIRIKDGETDELTTTIVIAYHQEGIQIAIGPCVCICHNQCILNAQRVLSTYGNDKISLDEIFMRVDTWLSSFGSMQSADREHIERMKNTILSADQLYMIIGMLTAMRVAHDSKDKTLADKVSTYPLNQSQISVFTEELLKLKQQLEVLTAWDVYNVATEIYKPMRAELPTLIPQNAAFAQFLENFIA